MKNKKSVRVIKILFYIAILLSTTSIFDNNTYAEHYLSLSTSSTHSIDVSGVGNGTTISSTEINVATTCQAGYNLSLTTTVNDNMLYLNGDVNNYATGDYISPADGSTSLVSANNTWGYYLPEIGGEAPTVNSVFSAVPTLGNSAVLRTPAQTARSTEINDTLSLYYGVKVTNTLTSGSYTMIKDEDENVGTVVYYATLPEECFRYVIEYNPTGTNTGVPVTGIGNIDNQYALEGIVTNLTSETYSNPTIDGIDYYFIGWNTAQDGTGTQYDSGESVTDLTSTGTTITLYAQWANCTSGKMCYLKNHSDAEGIMDQQSVSANTNPNLQAPQFTLENHAFVGWSQDKEAATKLTNHEEVSIYGPNEAIPIGDLPDYGISLYAVWLEVGGYLQDWDGCSTMDIGDVIALQDSRDDNIYTVAKLADAQCWTTENMRIDDSVDGQTMLSGSATLGDGFDVLPQSSDDWSTTGSTQIQFNNLNLIEGNYIYGGYYSWPATVASSANYTSGTQSANTSICPSGWRLPKGGTALNGSDNDYYSLLKSLTNEEPNRNQSGGNGYYGGADYSQIIRKFPNNFVYSGRWYDEAVSNRDSSGFYWTATSYNTGENAYYLYLDGTMVRPGNGSGRKYYGYAFRCISNS